MSPLSDCLLQTFHFEAVVADNEEKIISRRYFVPESYEIFAHDQPIIHTNCGHTYWKNIYIDPYQRNTLIVQAHVQGKRETKHFGISFEHKIKGEIKADITVHARKRI